MPGRVSEARSSRQIERLFMKNNLSKLFPFRLLREIPDDQLLHGTPMEERLDRSPAPWILTVILVWVVSVVLLVLTARVGNLAQGAVAQKDYRSPAEFEYGDVIENKKLFDEAQKKVPVFCRIIPERTEEIQRDLNDLFDCVGNRFDAQRRNRKYEPVQNSRVSKLVEKMSGSLLGELADIYRNNRKYDDFQQAWRQMLREGILPVEIRKEALTSKPLRTIDARERVAAPRDMGDIADSAVAAKRLARIIFPVESSSAEEFRKILLKVLGSGNLAEDAEMRRDAVDGLKRIFEQKTRRIKRNEVLIKKGQKVTGPLRDLVRAAERHVTLKVLLGDFFYRIALSFSLLGITIFFVFRIYPDMVKENRAIMLTGSILIASLTVNYLAVSVFHNSIAPRIADPVTLLSLKLSIPIAFCAILLTVTMGYRVAMCAGFFNAAVTVMMLSPDDPFVLLLRYLVLAALTGLAVRKVTNYRTLFIRSFGITVILLLVLNVNEIFFRPLAGVRGLREVVFIIAGNAFVTAVLTLVALFVFELAFNLSTNMALMVLCDYNHPLLERLKREAPGTMFHSMTVATLAEDAARSIGANPLKAKAGALFHDIGKLEKARYFVENNRSSDQLHQKLTPAQSARIILGHVLEGLRLAREKRLCRLVRDAIRTHHGDSLVYFFYAKAKAANPDVPVKKSLFQYSGPPPRGRELTIISLADACEAAVRSQDHPDPETIRAKVEEIFLGRIRDGQLRNSLLSLRDLDRVKESFIATLMSIHHGRIAYTTESINEAAAKQMEQPPSPRTKSGSA